MKSKKRILPNVIWVFPQICDIISESVNRSIASIARFIEPCFIDWYVDEFCFKELRNVDDDCCYNDRDDILGHPTVDAGTSDILSVVERMTNSRVSEDKDDSNKEPVLHFIPV